MKHFLEYLGVRLLDAFFGLLGPNLSMPVARSMGTLVYMLLPGKRKIAAENVRMAFGDEKSEDEVREIVLCAFQNLTMIAAEFCLAPRLLAKGQLKSRVRFESAEIMMDALAEGRGAILIGAHFTNWELAGFAISHMLSPGHSVTRTLKNPRVDAWVRSVREKSSQVVFPKAGALRSMIKLFREGKLLIFLLDQHAGDKGIPIQFFGRTAYTFDSVAMLSRRFNVPVIFGYDERIDNRFDHVMTVAARIDPEGFSVEELTAMYTKHIEDLIRSKPHTWLWMHRRWKESKASRRAITEENETT